MALACYMLEVYVHVNGTQTGRGDKLAFAGSICEENQC